MIKWFVYGMMLAGPSDPGFVKVFNCHIADTKQECERERQDLYTHYTNERKSLRNMISPCLQISGKTDTVRLCETLKKRFND